MERLKWIDLLRGFCMMAILWFHTEMYYVGYDKTPYAFYVGDVLAVFFILSGYLFYKSEPIDYHKKCYSIIRYLLIPYFIFTTIISVGKYFIYQDRTFASIGYEIISGHASWFITALILSQLLFILFLRITKGKLIYLSTIACISLILSYFIGNSYNPSPLYYPQNLWHSNESLLGLFLLYIGYIYHKYEYLFNRLNTISYTLLLFINVCIIKSIIYKYSIQLVLGPIIVTNYYVFIIDLLVTSLFLIQLFRLLPSSRLIEWTGSHSIVYYFICGGVPMLFSRILHKMNIYEENYLYVLCVFMLVYVACTYITKLIYKYTPIFRK